jgi:NitT/TauT family transport system substrate-binding protein
VPRFMYEPMANDLRPRWRPRAGGVWRVLGAVIFAITALTAIARSSSAQELTKIHLAAPAQDSATAALYAIQARLFRKAGLDVDIQPLNGTSQIAAAVAGGSVQIGVASLVSLIAAHARGIDFTIVAPSSLYVDSIPDHRFVVARTSTIQTAKNLDGKTIGVFGLRDLQSLAALAFIDKSGGDWKAARFLELPSGTLVTALAQGRIDAATLDTPNLPQALSAGTVRVIGDSYTGIGKRFLVGSWFTTADFADKNRDVIERFVRVMHDALVFTNTHHAETARILTSWTGVDPKIIPEIVRPAMAEYLLTSDAQPVIDAAARYGMIDRPFDAQLLFSPYALKPPGKN